MGNPDAAMLSLAESIADGQPIDWAEVEARAGAQDESIVRQLRVISELAGLHRSLSTLSMPPPDAARSRQVSAAPAIGSWGHLTLIERLGGGSSGDVYRAWDRHLERDVALKLLRINDSVADLDTSRITHEARLLARIHHPNVITVYGVASHDNRVGLWMELVRGITLAQQIRTTGPLSAQEAAVVGIDLCRALAAVHAAGLIHRDVKAQNVMREDGGRIVLMDLGTGRETGALSAGAAPDLAGTPLYLAPELFTGAPASERTDLYSLGILLYHVVTGSFPIRATTIQELHEMHTAGRIVRLRDARADLPTSFVRVIERAVAHDAQVRYATAGEFEADLAGSLDAVRPRLPRPARSPITARAAGWVAAAAAIVVLGVGFAATRWRTDRNPPTAAAVPASVRSIAVLPLVNLSKDPQQEYFADGMTDELIGALGRFRGMTVISRTSSMQFKSSKQPPAEIARALNVDAVLEGAVLIVSGPGAPDESTKRVRLNARLIEAGGGTQLWDKAFESVVTDIAALQGQVVSAIADSIHMKLTSAVAPARGAQDFESFDLYLRGRYYWNSRSEDGLKQSVRYFEEAIDRSPDFARAYAGLADAYNLLGEYGFISRADARSRAVAASNRALELDDSVAEAHVSLAFVDDDEFRWDAAEERFKRAIALKPGYVTAYHWYAYHLAQIGRFDEAIAAGSKAVELDPLSLGTNGELGAIYVYARRYDRAIVQLEKTVRMDPKFARGRTELAKAYLLSGDRQRARAEAEQALATRTSDAIALGDIGYVYAVTGRQRDARRIAADLVRRARTREDGTALAAAMVFAGLAELEPVFAWLDAARNPIDPQLAGFNVDPRFERVREDPRFRKLLATVGLAQ